VRRADRLRQAQAAAIALLPARGPAEVVVK
jgi:hypothetical protein